MLRENFNWLRIDHEMLLINKKRFFQNFFQTKLIFCEQGGVNNLLWNGGGEGEWDRWSDEPKKKVSGKSIQNEYANLK